MRLLTLVIVRQRFIMGILIGIVLLFGFMYIMGWAFQYDLKEMKKTHPKYRKYLKDRYGW